MAAPFRLTREATEILEREARWRLENAIGEYGRWMQVGRTERADDEREMVLTCSELIGRLNYGRDRWSIEDPEAPVGGFEFSERLVEWLGEIRQETIDHVRETYLDGYRKPTTGDCGGIFDSEDEAFEYDLEWVIGSAQAVGQEIALLHVLDRALGKPPADGRGDVPCGAGTGRPACG